MKQVYTIFIAGLVLALYQNCAPVSSSNESSTVNSEARLQPLTVRPDEDSSIHGIQISRRPPGTLRSEKTQIHFLLGPIKDSHIVDVLCGLDTTDLSPCSSPVELTELTEGAHTFTVRIIDEDGNQDEIELTWSVVSQEPRALALTGLPLYETPLRTAQFTYLAQDLGGGIRSVECRVDGEAFRTCMSPMFYEDLSLGEHIFEVRLTENLGAMEVLRQNWHIYSP